MTEEQAKYGIREYDPDNFDKTAQDKKCDNDSTKETSKELIKALDEARPKTPEELKDYFLESASEVIDQYVNAALGYEPIKGNMGCREEVWKLVRDLILTSSTKIELKVTSPEDVINAVQKGECTVEEAQAMLDIYKKVKDINKADVPVGTDGRPAGPQFLINIQGAETVEIEEAPTKKIEAPINVPKITD